MRKVLKIVLVLFLFLILLYVLSFIFNFYESKPEIGVSFSEYYVKDVLNLDWKKSYEEILKDLNPQNILLVAYWQYLEPQKDYFDFEDLDWQINLASSYGKNIILAIGQRVPRWPECHLPSWEKELSKEEMKKELLSYLETVIKRYKDNPFIKYWQIENEPYFSSFGNCSFFDKKLFEEEIDLVRKIDPQRPIMTTDSGEWGLWVESAKKADIFGTTLYRDVSMPILGSVNYFFISPAFYKLKAEIVKKFTSVYKVIISELQMEPWAPVGKSLVEVDFDSQVKNFSASNALNNFKYALKTGIKEIYIWGVEWWYYRKINGDESFWNLGKDIIRGNF